MIDARAGPLGSLGCEHQGARLDGPTITCEADTAFEAMKVPAAEEPMVSNSTGTVHGKRDTEELQGGEPLTRPQWLRALSECKDLSELGIRLAWGWQAGLLFPGASSAKPTRTAAPRRGGLFPLPVKVPEGLTWELAGVEPCRLKALATGCWVALGCVAMNRLFGVTCAETRRAGKIHAAVLADLTGKLRGFFQGK